MSIIDDLKREEGAVLRAGRHIPYKCPAGKLTIGYGRNIESSGISQAEAELLLANDVETSEVHLRNVFPNWDNFSRGRKDTLINMRFQLGKSGFLSFKRMISAIRAGDWYDAADEIKNSKAHSDSVARGSLRWTRHVIRMRGGE